jgi:aspartokinase-like uncharacterized kinase
MTINLLNLPHNGQPIHPSSKNIHSTSDLRKNQEPINHSWMVISDLKGVWQAHNNHHRCWPL